MGKYRVKVTDPTVPEGTSLDVPDLGGLIENGGSMTVELSDEQVARLKDSSMFEVRKAGKEEDGADSA